MSVAATMLSALTLRSSRLGLLAAASLLSASAASAQVTLRLTGSPSGAPGVSAAVQATSFGPSAYWTSGAGTINATSSPYLATASIGSSSLAITVICVDLLSTASFNDPYAINVTSLANPSLSLLDTRWVNGMQQQIGTSGGNATYQTLGNADAMRRYRTASYLGSFMTAENTADWNDIQLAIWEVMTPYTVRNDVSAWTSTSAGAWLTQATQAAAAGFVGYDFSNAYVLTDATVDDASPELQGARAHLGRQEFVTAATRVVPEPSTYMLLGTGIAALGLVARRRRTS
jgi:hypothetical protein